MGESLARSVLAHRRKRRAREASERASGPLRYWSETLDLSRGDRFRDGSRLKL